MKDFQLTKHNIQELFTQLSSELNDSPVIAVTSKNPSVGSWGMARLWRAWMETTAKWMAGNGAKMPLCIKLDGLHYGSRHFNSNDAHELFTAQWLGVDSNGKRLSWAKKSHDGMVAANKGERWLAMFKHDQYALERGLLLFKPVDSEYSKLEMEQNQ